MMKKNYFKEWRKQADLTQEEAAERMGFTRPYLSKLESGKGKEQRRYNADILEAMARVYHCRVHDLFLHPKDLVKDEV